MTRRELLRQLACAGAAAALPSRLARGAAKRPNILFILVDDLGWADLSCYGSTFYETPHTDRLAAQGMRFTNAYAACPVCSPTRASILTGKYPARLHLTDWIAGHQRPWAKLNVPDWTKYLPLREVTLADTLQAQGYATASIGKWHLGGQGYEPTRQGFDLNLGGTDRGQPPTYFSPYRIPTLEDGPKGEYLTDRLTDEAIRFITDHRDDPWFLYLPQFAVHTPIQAKEDVTAKYQAKLTPGQRQRNPKYAAMVEGVDDSVGRLMQCLDDLGLADNTIVVYMSDNGGLASVTSNYPLRAGKGTMYEGGVREPLIVRWPGRVRPGSTCDEVVTSIDFCPTLLDAVGAPASDRPEVDGISFLPLLRETGHLEREAIYWHYPHYHPGGATPFGAVRAGDWKLIEFYEGQPVELYNLAADLGEEHNLAAAEPARVARLRQMLAEWRVTVAAQMPTANPNYDPARANQPPGKPKPER